MAVFEASFAPAGFLVPLVRSCLPLHKKARIRVRGKRMRFVTKPNIYCILLC